MRTFLSVLAAYALWSVLWLGSNAALQVAMPDAFDDQGATDSAGILFGLIVFAAVISVAAGCLAVTIARNKRAALWTAIALLATGIPVQLGFWELLPVWYHIAFLVLLVPATMLGGSMRSPSTAPA